MRFELDRILKDACANVEPSETEHIGSIDEEQVSAELDSRVLSLIRSHRRSRRLRFISSAAAVIVLVACIGVYIFGHQPEKYLVGDISEPKWFPAEVDKTLVENTDTLFKAVYKTEDGREFVLLVGKKSSGASIDVLGGDIYQSSGSLMEYDHETNTGSTAYYSWESDGLYYRISGNAKEIELRRMAKSMLEE